MEVKTAAEPGSLRDHVMIVARPGMGQIEWAREQRARVPYAAWDARQGDAEYLYRCAGLGDSWATLKRPGNDRRWDGGWRMPPLRAPHHTVSEQGLTGRVVKGWQLRPGELSFAHGGVLLLDEAQEMRLSVLEKVLEVARDGFVRLGFEGNQTVRIPAEFRLVVVVTPCSCGFRGSSACHCSEEQVARYWARLAFLSRVCRLVLEAEWQAEVKALRARGEVSP